MSPKAFDVHPALMYRTTEIGRFIYIGPYATNALCVMRSDMFRGLFKNGYNDLLQDDDWSDYVDHRCLSLWDRRGLIQVPSVRSAS